MYAKPLQSLQGHELPYCRGQNFPLGQVGHEIVAAIPIAQAMYCDWWMAISTPGLGTNATSLSHPHCASSVRRLTFIVL